MTNDRRVFWNHVWNIRAKCNFTHLTIALHNCRNISTLVDGIVEPAYRAYVETETEKTGINCFLEKQATERFGAVYTDGKTLWYGRKVIATWINEHTSPSNWDVPTVVRILASKWDSALLTIRAILVDEAKRRGIKIWD